MVRHVARLENEFSLPSQRLVEAALRGDLDCVTDGLGGGVVVDVNYIGTVSLRVKCTKIILHEEGADEVKIEYEEFRTDVTALFTAAHSGHLDVTRKLLSAGADVNQELFRGYATTAAAREGHCDLLSILLKAGASQPACEDALLEASLCGEAKAAELLICSEMTRPDVAAHALVSASCRGFVDVVTVLIKNGVDVNCMSRVLLRSAKPTLHSNVDCTPLVAAIVSRQASVVRYLLEVGAKTDCKVRLGAWAWDTVSGEELRVGACLAEPYIVPWCAVEYYEGSGYILKMLLNHHPTSLLENQHHGRTLLCHAILCQNSEAARVLLEAGSDSEFCIKTKMGHKSHPIHLAARLGCLPILKQLISHGCQLDSKSETGETATMLAAKSDHADCFLELVMAGANLGVLSDSGESVLELVTKSAFSSSIADIFRQVVIAGKGVQSTDLDVFSLLHFVAANGHIDILQMLLRQFPADLNKPDGHGLTPVMVAAKAGQAEALRLLIMAGADISLKDRDGQTVVSLLQLRATDRDRLEHILLDAVLAHVLRDSTFKALHYAAREENLGALIQLLKMGFSVNSVDENGNSPLMLAAREGHANSCKLLLIQGGADCTLVNKQGETALALARKNSRCKIAESVILDHLARLHVLAGEELCKHTRKGRGVPHMKTVRMLRSGFLTWGKSNRRNVLCKEAAVGPSESFRKNRGKDVLDGKKVIFRVVTVTGREVHFEGACLASVELWVRGINLIAKDVELDVAVMGNAVKN